MKKYSSIEFKNSETSIKIFKIKKDILKILLGFYLSRFKLRLKKIFFIYNGFYVIKALFGSFCEKIPKRRSLKTKKAQNYLIFVYDFIRFLKELFVYKFKKGYKLKSNYDLFPKIKKNELQFSVKSSISNLKQEISKLIEIDQKSEYFDTCVDYINKLHEKIKNKNTDFLIYKKKIPLNIRSIEIFLWYVLMFVFFFLSYSYI
jgi:hypothetical protein